MKTAVAMAVFSCLGASAALADPCGMVPPIYTGPGAPISRIGLQQTYVFYKDGIETFVIRPGFSGKVDTFGMLIPFPTPPAIRKVPDDVFAQIANAVDPPEVVVDFRVYKLGRMGGGDGLAPAMAFNAIEEKESVRVLREEAVGMYEVAVLQAGSPLALQRWMEQNGYQYPVGMDEVCSQYIDADWCFVAVKTKVGQMAGVQPRPGQRDVQAQLPEGSMFDGHVQGMGFRFPTDELVVPMRLSAFNEGELRNVVYLLADEPKKIRAIPEEYVVRQVSGRQLIENMSQPLPLRIIGGTRNQISDEQWQDIATQRNPEQKNGVAKQLFSSDLLAVQSGQLALPHEEAEKELLRIGEHFGLRGAEIDLVNAAALASQARKVTEAALQLLQDMTLTVVDGDFPREVLADQNLTFASYRMPAGRNNRSNYDASVNGPEPKKDGTLETGAWSPASESIRLAGSAAMVLASGILFGALFFCCRRGVLLALLPVTVAATVVVAAVAAAQDTPPPQTPDEMVAQLKDSATSDQAINAIVEFAGQNKEQRDRIIAKLDAVARTDEHLPRRGWAIAAMTEIGGQDVDEMLLNIHADEKQQMVVRTWAAAARVAMTRTTAGLIEKANLIAAFPALGRPIGMRLVEQMSADQSASIEDILGVTLKVAQLQQALAPAIMAFGPDKLSEVMIQAKDQEVRRQAAGYLGALASQGEGGIAEAVKERLKFDGSRNTVPWNNGPLFVPGISWGKEDARQLVGSLIRWHLWCNERNLDSEMAQIHNNIRSLGLAEAAGYQSPGWDDVGSAQWLRAWGDAMGRAEVERILSELDIDPEKYRGVLDDLRK